MGTEQDGPQQGLGTWGSDGTKGLVRYLARGNQTEATKAKGLRAH